MGSLALKVTRVTRDTLVRLDKVDTRGLGRQGIVGDLGHLDIAASLDTLDSLERQDTVAVQVIADTLDKLGDRGIVGRAGIQE